MPTLLQLSANLKGEIPSLPRLLAQKYINKALLEIRRDYLWSWNIGEGILIMPNMVTTGSVTVTQFSNQVQLDAAAATAVDAIQNANPPLISRQFRMPQGPVYNIVAYDNVGKILTLDRIYTESTSAGAGYMIYRCYYDPPSTDGINPNADFLRYLTINNPIEGYTISGYRINRPRAELNRRDPMRGSVGPPYFAFAYRPVPITSPATFGLTTGGPTNGQMQYEFWPHPVTQGVLLAQYERQHVDLVANDFIPAQCPETLVIYRALEYAYRWAAQNVGRDPSLKGTDWRYLLVEVQKKYKEELISAKRNDKEIMVTILRPTSANMGMLGPIDSNWAQSHAVPGY